MSRDAVEQFPVLTDNYVYLIDGGDGAIAVVDPSESAFLFALEAERAWQPRFQILNTHHHADHTGGNLAIKARYGAAVTGPRNDERRIPGIDTAVSDGELVRVGALTGTTLDVPGHTRGHCAFHFPEIEALFCGDTLFSLGCGRLFEGTPAQMFASLAKFKVLPPATKVYCAHEYTEANYRFAIAVDPGNADLRRRGDEIRALRSAGKPTVPSTIGQELACNPFLRARTVEDFAALRRQKDAF